jgi:hypothetical protein
MNLPLLRFNINYSSIPSKYPNAAAAAAAATAAAAAGGGKAKAHTSSRGFTPLTNVVFGSLLNSQKQHKIETEEFVHSLPITLSSYSSLSLWPRAGPGARTPPSTAILTFANDVELSDNSNSSGDATFISVCRYTRSIAGYFQRYIAKLLTGPVS